MRGRGAVTAACCSGWDDVDDDAAIGAVAVFILPFQKSRCKSNCK